MKKLNHSGSHLIAIALIVVAAGVIGFIGYKVSQNGKSKADTVKHQTTTAQVPASINSVADLDQAEAVLDQAAPQVNSNLDDNGFNSDLNSML